MLVWHSSLSASMIWKFGSLGREATPVPSSSASTSFRHKRVETFGEQLVDLEEEVTSRGTDDPARARRRSQALKSRGSWSVGPIQQDAARSIFRCDIEPI